MEKFRWPGFGQTIAGRGSQGMVQMLANIFSLLKKQMSGWMALLILFDGSFYDASRLLLT
ncbi:hypothetical protein AK821_13235 [Pseudomonas sp. RIT-PI-r]|nr:hypothetical protein AK821_13235 [Pseudomonas sp. RIT-PI-r]